MPVRFLSGGERNRVLLAKLFSKAANVIVLDEPTNDLDTETLELLEEQLTQFDGTVLVVSHDRAFLNQVVSSTIVFDDGNISEYVGGYDDWQRQKAQAESVATAPTSQRPDKGSQTTLVRETKKLGFKEKKELQVLPSQVESLEARITELHTRMGDPSFFQQSKAEIRSQQQELQRAQDDLRQAYFRWEELESLRNS